MNTTPMGKHLLAGCVPYAVQPALHAGIHAVMRRIAICSVSLLCMLAIHPAIAAEADVGKYQSSFYGYKPMTADSAEDWSATNQRVTAGDHSRPADHSQHSMHHEALVQQTMVQQTVGQQATVPPSPTKEPGEGMAGMDHGNMEQTDHSSMHRDQTPSDQTHHEQMHHDHTMPPMPAMDHNDKSGAHHVH